MRTLDEIGNEITDVEKRLSEASSEDDRGKASVMLNTIELMIRAIELGKATSSEVSESTKKEIMDDMMDWTSKDLASPDEDFMREPTPELLQQRLTEVKDLLQKAKDRLAQKG